MLFVLVYITGMLGTLYYHGSVHVEREFANILFDREETSWPMNMLLITWAYMTSFFWPIYWAGRALYAVPEVLALGPGEPQ